VSLEEGRVSRHRAALVRMFVDHYSPIPHRSSP
jgi:hypothetical protein